MINNGGEMDSCALLYPKCLIALGQSSVVDIMKSLHSFYQYLGYFTIFFSHSESIEVEVTCLSTPLPPSSPALYDS